jgi:hypothetical protein
LQIRVTIVSYFMKTERIVGVHDEKPFSLKARKPSF